MIKSITFLLCSIALLIIFSCKEDLPIQERSNNHAIEVISDSVFNISGSSAMAKGHFADKNIHQVEQFGFCFDTTENPTIDGDKITIDSFLIRYECRLEGLQANKTYFVRAFASTNYSTVYGNTKSFTTLDGFPTLDTIVIEETKQTSIKISSKIINDGGYPITTIGVCWHKSSTPTIDHNIVVVDSIVSNFLLEINNLNYNTYYYIRHFAINKQGITYGKKHRVLTGPGIPKMGETSDVSSPYFYERHLNSKVLSDGGSELTELGFCWSTHNNPTFNDSVGTIPITRNNPSYYVTASNLASNTKYFYRAFASNAVGTAFGDTKSFTTKDGSPEIYAWYPYPVTKNSATFLVDIKNKQFEVTKFGICYSKTPNPEETDSIILKDYIDENQHYDTLHITNLEENTLFYYKIVVENQYGRTETDVNSFYTYNLPVKPLEFVTVEGGTFTMGYNKEGTDESPAHEVTISSFQMSSTEVTVNQFMEFLEKEVLTHTSVLHFNDYFMTNSTFSQIRVNAGDELFYFKSSPNTISPDCPVVLVTLKGAKDFCEWMGGRLPTEAEWEFAAKGGNLSNGYTCSGSNITTDVAWTAENSNRHLHPVGQKLPNELGIYDMSGNAAERCSDFYNADYYKNSPLVDPQGPESGDDFSYRGSSYLYPELTRLSIRYNWPLDFSPLHYVSFRVVKDL